MSSLQDSGAPSNSIAVPFAKTVQEMCDYLQVGHRDPLSPSSNEHLTIPLQREFSCGHYRWIASQWCWKYSRYCRRCKPNVTDFEFKYLVFPHHRLDMELTSAQRRSVQRLPTQRGSTVGKADAATPEVGVLSKQARRTARRN